MAFKNWQIGLHLQQQEAVAVAIVRSAKECLLHRWWRLPLENDIIKDGRIVDVQRLANTLLPWSRELPQRHHIMLAFPASRTLQRSFPRPSMSLGEREQMAWLSGTMARELDKAAPATIYPRLAICAGSTGGAFTRTFLADNDKLAAGNAGDQGADNKHCRVKRAGNVTPPGCFFSSQSEGGHAAGCAGTLAI